MLKDKPDRDPRLAETLSHLCFLSQPRLHCEGARTSHSKTTPEYRPSPCSRHCDRVQRETIARCISLVSQMRSDGTVPADDEISVCDRRPSVSPQLFQRREVVSISSSATDWCADMSCKAVSAHAGAVLRRNQGKTRE